MTAADPEVWIRRFHRSPEAATRLVCFPHAGGSASYFHPLSAALAPAHEVWAIQYPGRQDRRREPFAKDIPELADQVFAALRGRVEEPFAFFGHSMGALVAFEVARRWRRTGEAGPARLVLSGRRAASTHRDELLDLDDEDAVVAELRRLGGTADQFLADRELLDTILPVTRADYGAVGAYTAGPDAVVDVPLLVLVGDRDPVTTIEEATAWERHSTASCEVRVFSGGHFFLEPRAAEVIATLQKEMDTLRSVSEDGEIGHSARERRTTEGVSDPYRGD
ncbi:thioesterase [Actinomadura spongiicola]|uniref:Thioesterase n=1 Tax=Actinomadura spongiicola TaxID=2303421 RepID=A0A372GMJ3_9ACTN|nr:alpha/beta fold hydrolase [Actinomadura spongiicola]RFS86610.1 thioesterase [Actinomadura spongiicola]